jgi:hypothetical protein
MCCKVVAHRASLIPWPWPGGVMRYFRWRHDLTGTFREGSDSTNGPWFIIDHEHDLSSVFTTGIVTKLGLPAYTPTEPQPTRCGGTES